VRERACRAVRAKERKAHCLADAPGPKQTLFEANVNAHNSGRLIAQTTLASSMDGRELKLTLTELWCHQLNPMDWLAARERPKLARGALRNLVFAIRARYTLQLVRGNSRTRPAQPWESDTSR
jgi:hypothetical protein